MKRFLEVKIEEKDKEIIEINNIETLIEVISEYVDGLLIPDEGDFLYDYIEERDFDMLELDLKRGYSKDVYDEVDLYIKTIKYLYGIKKIDELPSLIEQCNSLFDKLNVNYRFLPLIEYE